MASGKTQDDEKNHNPRAAPDKKPEPEIDPLAKLIDNFGDEVEPVKPQDDAGKGPAEGN